MIDNGNALAGGLSATVSTIFMRYSRLHTTQAGYTLLRDSVSQAATQGSGVSQGGGRNQPSATHLLPISIGKFKNKARHKGYSERS